MRRLFGILTVTIVGVVVGCTVPPPGPTVLAIAYTEVDGVVGFDDARGDVLIAKLVDTNGDGAASAGDTVTTNRYPTSTDPVPPFGSFGVTTHEVTEIAIEADELVAFTTFPTTGHEWADSASFGERYGEFGPGSVGQADTGFIDEFRSGTVGGVDFIAVDPMSPSRPEDSIPDRPSFDGQGDDAFVQVDLFIAMP
jgi:hypothetical protein